MDELVAWLRDQIEATLLLPWHLPNCQMLKPVPAEIVRAMPLMAGGYSCNCELTTERLNQHLAHTAILEAHDNREVASLEQETWGQTFIVCRWCRVGDRQVVQPCPTLRALALAYQHRDGYREEWRP